MTFFRREHAPIDEAAWNEIETVVGQTLRTHLTARRVVDVDGPHGLEHAAVNLGRLDPIEQAGRVNYGLRQVQPLVELRVPFELSIWELDNLARGADDLDLDAAIEAASRVAEFEEHAVYEGFHEAQIRGLGEITHHDRLRLPESPDEIPAAVATAVQKLVGAGVSGPYALVLPAKRRAELASDASTYPPKKRVESLLEGGPILGTIASTVSHAFMVSLRGGDLRLTLGQDLALGYDTHDAQNVKLYLTESFTFRILGPEAAVVFDL